MLNRENLEKVNETRFISIIGSNILIISLDEIEIFGIFEVTKDSLKFYTTKEFSNIEKLSNLDFSWFLNILLIELTKRRISLPTIKNNMRKDLIISVEAFFKKHIEISKIIKK